MFHNNQVLHNSETLLIIEFHEMKWLAYWKLVLDRCLKLVLFGTLAKSYVIYLPLITCYLSSVNHKPSILMMRRDGQKRKIIRKMCI